MAKKAKAAVAAAATVGGVPPVVSLINPQSVIMDLEKNRKAGMDAESISSLAESIKTHGMLQPVMMNKVGDELWCVFGHRRTLAAIQAGLETIPAIVRENMSEKDIEAARCIENEQNEDTSFIDKAKSITRLKAVGWNQNEISKMINKFPADISRILSLLKLNNDLQGFIHDNRMTMTSGLSLVKATKKEQEIVAAKCGEVIGEMVANGASDPEIRRATTKIVDAAVASPDSTGKPPRTRNTTTTQNQNTGNITDITPPAAAPAAAVPAVPAAPAAPAPAAPAPAAPAPAAPAGKSSKGKDELPEMSPVQKNLKIYEDLLDLLCKLEDATEGKTKKIFGRILDMVDGKATAEDILKIV